MRKALVYSFLLLTLAAPGALAFGTVSKDVPFLGQDQEHEKITRAALRQLEARTLDELAGTSLTFGAVGAPDDPARGLLSTDAAHCDNADHLEVTRGEAYRQSAEEAQDHLISCREWMVRHLERAVDLAGALAKPDENNTSLPCGAFFGKFTGNAKCNTIEALGLVLHAAEDFYSHTNWVDIPAEEPFGPNNPPGLGRTGPAPWLDLRRETEMPTGLISGCFTALPEWAFCNNSGGALPTKHDDLNKDKGPIVGGVPGIGRTNRGSINGNFARAVNAAIADARDKWAHFEEEVRKRYGADADPILCALRKDDASTCAEIEEPEADPRQVAEARNARCERSYAGSVFTGIRDGKELCGCATGWRWNRADNACITAEARAAEDATESCKASYPGSVFTSMRDGRPRCGCPAGWAWNLADKACITQAALQAERQRACSNLPGSVFQRVDPADNRAICDCPDGMGWNAEQTACVRQSAGNSGIANPDQLARGLEDLFTALSGNGRSTTGTGGPLLPPRNDSGAAQHDDEEWGIYLIDLGPGGMEVLHGSKRAIRATRMGSLDGFGRGSETIGELVDTGAIKMVEVSRAATYEDVHGEFQALYARTTPSNFWGRFIRISESEIHKYNNPEPIGAPR
jgi:hypothetical protein